MRRGIQAVLPLKSPDTAKSRLRSLLTDSERRTLFFFMARNVLGVLSATSAIEGVIVVTASAEVASFVRQWDARVIRQNEEDGASSAFALGVAALTEAPGSCIPTGVLMLAGDLPLITAGELSRLIASLDGQNGIAIAPDRWHVGTNALFCSPPNAIPPCFGPGSFQRHLTAARENRVAAHVLDSEALSLDIDTPEDFAQWRGFAKSMNP